MIIAAGHPGAQQENGLFIKPTISQEIKFYQHLIDSDSKLLQYVPKFIGTLTEHVKHESKSKVLVVLEDLCTKFLEPNVVDIKLGSVLFDSSADLAKRERLSRVSGSTTSGALGFRIAGASLIRNERVHIGKDYGREASTGNIKSYLEGCFPFLNENRGVRKSLELIILELRKLVSVLEEVCVEMHSSSVLLIYEGGREGLDSESQMHIEVKLIDFARSKPSDSVDLDCINGLRNLISLLSEL